MDLRDRTAATRAEAKIRHPKMGDISGLLANQGRERVSNATSMDTLNGISLRGKDPRVLGWHSPSHQWDMHGHNLFLLTPMRAKGTSISPRCCTSAFYCTYRSERLEYRPRSRAGLTSQDFKDLGACLRYHTIN